MLDTSLVTKEMQIKRHHLTLVKTAFIKDTNNKGWLGKDVGKRQECKLVQPLRKAIQRSFKKLKTELS
jgi:predicted DNA-binding transcriptional regulator